MHETTMQIALKEAGVPVKSKKERIWNTVNDMGEATTDRICSVLKDIHPSYVNALAALGGLKTRQERRRVSNGHMRNVSLYSTAHATWEEANEVIRANASATQAKYYKPKAAGKAPIIQTAPAAKPAAASTKLPQALEAMTLAQLREVHAALNRLFGE